MDYKHRKAFVPDCLRLTLRIVDDVSWLPGTCAYRLRAEGRPLPHWHYLVSGDRDAVVGAGVSVAGRVSEDEAGPLEHHVVDWDDDYDDDAPQGRGSMIDWLRREAIEPEIELGDRTLPIDSPQPPCQAIDASARARWQRGADHAAALVPQRRGDRLRPCAPRLADRTACENPSETRPGRRPQLMYRGTQIALDWRADAPRRPDLDDETLTIGGPQDTLTRRLQRWPKPKRCVCCCGCARLLYSRRARYRQRQVYPRASAGAVARPKAFYG